MDEHDDQSGKHDQADPPLVEYPSPRRSPNESSAEGLASCIGGSVALGGVVLVLSFKLPEAYSAGTVAAAFIISLWSTIFGVLGVRRNAHDPFAITGVILSACILLGTVALGAVVGCFLFTAPYGLPG